MKQLLLFCAVGFGSGFAPVAPGTFGTLFALMIYFLFLQKLSVPIYLLVLIISFLLGIYLCYLATVQSQVDDPPSIVWDEFVGLWITLFFVPSGWIWVLAGFLLFRLFDIVKPWPIQWCDRKIKGGFGIMLDDVLAGIFAWVVLQGLFFIVTQHSLGLFS